MRDIIFDFDGTIIDSSECIYSIYKTLFKEKGLEIPPDDKMKTFIGPPIEYVIKDYVEPNEIANTSARFRELYNNVDLKRANKLYDGIEELLERLKNSGKRLFVATTKNEIFANKIAEILGIKKYFNAIYGSRFEINRLTKSGVIEDLCKDFAIKKDDCILIGDTHFDAEGAKEAKIPVAMVNYGFGDREKLKTYDIEFYADTPSEVGEIILNKYAETE